MKRWLAAVSVLAAVLILSMPVHAGGAGVGIINVPPNYQHASLFIVDDYMYISLNLSDYNSWEDIYLVTVQFLSKGALVVEFQYQQYESRGVFNRTDEFRQTVGVDDLNLARSSVKHSNQTITINDRCLLNVTFAFEPFRFTDIVVAAYDTAGEYTTIAIDYAMGGGAVLRRDGMLITPLSKTVVTVDQTSIDSFVFGIALASSVALIRLKFR